MSFDHTDGVQAGELPPATPAPRAARWRRALGASGAYAHLLVPAALFLVIALFTLWLWRLEVRHEAAQVRTVTALEARAAAQRWAGIVRDDLRPLRRLGGDIANERLTDPDRFVEEIGRIQRAVTSLEVVAWVGDDGTARAVSTVGAADELKEGVNVRDVPGWRDALALATRPNKTVFFVGRLNGQPTQWAYVPQANPADGEGRKPRALLMGRFNFQSRAVEAFEGESPSFNTEIRGGDGQRRLIYTSARDAAERSSLGAAFAAEREVAVGDSTWTIRLQPTDAYIAAQRGDAQLFVLCGGFLTAALASAVCAQSLVHRRRTRRRMNEYLAALAALAKVSATISDAPASPSDLLARLARVAARLMNMSMSSVTLYDPRDRTMRVVFRDNLPNPNGRDVYDMNEAPCSAECMRTLRPIAFADVEAPGSPFPPGHMGRFGIRSLILVPLIVSDQAAGVLMLCDGAPRRFTELDRRLVDLWMIQASAILSNRKLYEGMTAAMENERQILYQRAKLYEVNTRIQYAPNLRDALRLVAELAPQALEFHACVVCLAHPTPGHVLVAAVTPGQATDELREDVVAECATCAGVMAGGGLKRVEDLREHPVRGFPHMGSALFVPLMSGGASVGLLVLLRIARGPFSAEQVRVAELFAARAAAKLESDRLLEQTCRQADTNAILLRELNHRVGNTFAGIIGLLKVAARELPDDARAPLDRAVQRVMTMSRAHELFSGGVRSVRLADLVQTTVASVSSFGGDGDVRINVELHDPDARLFSTRAVTLAMALHELAYNAVEHALGGGGELTVRSRATANQRIAIDVIDRAAAPALAEGSAGEAPDSTNGNGHAHDNGNGNGNGNATGDATGSRRRGNGHAGIGLQLVRNLVARELSGRFDLNTTDTGTTATIEFSPEQESECAL